MGAYEPSANATEYACPYRKNKSKPSDKLWRYLDKFKLVDLLTSKAIYLRRIDLLQDDFEGKITNKLQKHLDLVKKKMGFDDVFNKSQSTQDHRDRYRKFYFTNCWYRGESESADMWDSYLQGNPGIAIQTTF